MSEQDDKAAAGIAVIDNAELIGKIMQMTSDDSGFIYKQVVDGQEKQIARMEEEIAQLRAFKYKYMPLVDALDVLMASKHYEMTGQDGGCC